MSEQTIFDDSSADVISAAGQQTSEQPVLVILDGGDFKQRFTLDKAEMIIGRDVTCDVSVSDSKISRNHARLTYVNIQNPDEQPRVFVTDLGSTNGTYVNGQKITEHELKERDKLAVGSVLFGFFLRDETTKKADENLLRLATCDPLTGIHNRGIFNMEIQREFARSKRYGRPASLVMFDIDHFKKFNDTWGHQAGDVVLREMGHLCHANCRSNDMAARYGGEEFAIILPETPLENALVQAERLRKAVESHRVKAAGEVLKVTISVGVAQVESWMECPEDFIGAADRALYASKHAGRNQVTSSTGDPNAKRDGTTG